MDSKQSETVAVGSDDWLASERERLGRRVRDEWIAWAKEQPNTKASWLVEWESLDEPDKEVDRRIGIALSAEGARNPRRLLQQMLDVAENRDETGYVDGVGFVDIDKLHAEVRSVLANIRHEPRPTEPQ